MFRYATLLGLLLIEVYALKNFFLADSVSARPRSLDEIYQVLVGLRGDSQISSISKLKTTVNLHDVCPLLKISYKNASHREEVLLAIKEAGNKYNVEEELLLAVLIAESGCQKDARSSRGAMGFMQITPATAKWAGITKPYAVRQNISAGARYLSYLLEEFDGDTKIALAAYNAGPSAVRKYSSIPPYRETKTYVSRVMTYYKIQKNEKVNVEDAYA